MSLLITNAGIAASIHAGELGVSYKITHIAIGLEGYLPTLDQTQLKNEVAREALTRGSVPALGQLHFEAVFADEKEFEGKEIGYYLEDGTLFAVDSRGGEILSLKRSNTIITEALELNLAGSSIDNITVEIMGTPYATEVVAGIAKITTIDKMNSNDDETIVTPKKLKDKTATDEDIDMESSEAKFIQLPQFWRGVRKLVLDKLWLPLAELIHPVGCPISYPHAEAPTGFIAFVGQPFDKTVFTKLAERFPSGVMPDMRKSYIRGLGEGEVVLSRKIQSVQPLGFSGNQLPTHRHPEVRDNDYGGSGNGTRGSGHNSSTFYNGSVSAGTPSGRVTGTGDETNPNSLRWLYITRAA